MKAVKIFGKILLALLVLAILLFVGVYFYFQQKFPVDEEKYPNYIGYIDQEKAQLNDVYTLCDGERLMHVHHGAAEEGYFVNKKYYRDNILATYKNDGYTDSGYLNFRFLVNCKGEPGWFKTIQVDKNYNPTKFSKDMVAQLLELTAQPQHWNSLTYKEEPFDYYMYVSYKIENGTIAEILP